VLRAIQAACLLLALAACAGNNRFVLLPDEDGSVGAITVENRAGSQTLSEAGAGTRVGSARAAPGTPEAVTQEDIRSTWAGALSASPMRPRTFLFYFIFASDELTEQSRAQLPAILDSIRQFPAPEVAVIGHTDRVGPETVNARLGLERAEAIRAVLLQEGIAPALLEVTSHGEANPLVPTADEVPEPRNRRVEVMVR
jgi:outer membrane protein OmpA-like peptidoglycan-associated protein